MSNYIDLIGQITERLDVPCGNIRLGIHEALAYLDRYPDQAPGRTITESRLAEVLADENWTFTPTHYFRVFSRLGITVVPDPELEPGPEDVRKLAQALAAAAFDKPWESFDDLARQALKRGVTAPGADSASKARSDAAWDLNIDRQGGA